VSSEETSVAFAVAKRAEVFPYTINKVICKPSSVATGLGLQNELVTTALGLHDNFHTVIVLAVEHLVPIRGALQIHPVGYRSPR